MNFYLTILSCLYLVTMTTGGFAETGNEKGNGGDAVVCRDNNKEIKSIDVLDFFEARSLYNLTIPAKNPHSRDQIVQSVLKRIGKFDTKRASRYNIDASEFMKNANFLPGVTLVDIPDSRGDILPTGCQIEQLVIRNERTFPEQKLYTVSKDLWDRLNSVQQAGMILHEVVYGETGRLGQTNSIKARYLNGWIFSDRFQKIAFSEYQQLIDRVGLPFELATSSEDGSCEGVHLPGDYINLEEAIHAVNGTKATICLDVGTFDARYLKNITLADNSDLKIRGKGRGKSIVNGSDYTSVTCGLRCSILFEDFSFIGNLSITGYDESFASIDLQGIDIFQLLVDFNRNANCNGNGKGDLRISGIRIGYMSVQGNKCYRGKIIFENSVVDSTLFPSTIGGVKIGGVNLTGLSIAKDQAVIVRNNIFMNVNYPGPYNAIALAINSGHDAALQIANNVFINNRMAIYGRNLVSTHNSFFGNTSNFGGGALAGEKPITKDPMLDFTFNPPIPKPGSPLIQAGDPKYAPSHDFFGRPRGSFSDVGPVQSQK